MTSNKKFKSKTKAETTFSTSSLPDIVFQLLFFFMVSATIQKDDNQIKPILPEADNFTRAEKKMLLKELFVGESLSAELGGQMRISDGERYLALEQVAQWASEQKSSLPEQYQDQMIVLLRADEAIRMGMIGDIQEKLRDVGARKIIYRTKK